MTGFIIFLIAVLIVVGSFTVAIKLMKNQKKKMQELGAKDVCLVDHVEGLELPKNTFCRLYRLDNQLLIDSQQRKYEIKYENIKIVSLQSERELIQKGKSVVGRAIIGQMLVPGLGAIVGGMSGIGTKTKKGKMNHFLIINYAGVDGEMRAVTFLSPEINLIKAQKFVNSLIHDAGISNAQEVAEL